MASIGHLPYSNRRSIFTLARIKSKKEKCNCVICKNLTSGYRFNTSSNSLDKNISRKNYCPQASHICRVSDGDREFWANSRCVASNENWQCACFNCVSKKEETAETSSDAEQLVISLKGLDITKEVEVIIRNKKRD